MIAFNDIQKLFLGELKKKIPANMSFAEVLADDLNISIDSAYRRLRSDTNLTFDELRVLCNKYKISLDSFLSSSTESVTFNYRAIDYKGYNLEDYLRSIYFNIEGIRRYEAKQLIYTAKDIPIFQIFRHYSLAGFKIFFWGTKIYEHKDFESSIFHLKDLSDDLKKLTRKIMKNYCQVPSIEIWTDETINNILRQIEFCYFKDKIESSEVALQLCEDVRDIISHLKSDAEMGYKSGYNSNEQEEEVKHKFDLYYNKIIIPENMVYYRMGDHQMVHLGHNVLNILSSSDSHFCTHTYNVIQKLIRNSVKIDSRDTDEKISFFNNMTGKIDQLEGKIKSHLPSSQI